MISDDDDDVDPEGWETPVTSVETQVLVGRDDAARALADLDRRSAAAVLELSRLTVWVGRGVAVAMPEVSWRRVVLAYSLVRRFVDPMPSPMTLGRAELPAMIRDTERPVAGVFDICQRWGYEVDEPTAPKGRVELLAVDLTERLCTSHLRIGVRRDRVRGELCDWCYRHGPLLVATWVAPPVDVVRLHVENGRVKASEIEPFIRSERDRQRNLSKAKR